MYITGCRAHLCHLPGLGQVGHFPRGASGSAGTLDWGPMWSGSQSTCHQISDQPKAWQVDILWHGWLAAQLQLASWLAACLSHKMSTWPSPGRYMLWPCVWLLWSQGPVVRYTPTVEASSGQEQYYVMSAQYVVSLWVRLTFSQAYPPVEASGSQEWY